MEITETPVIFRWWNEELIALFMTSPSDISTWKYCDSYMHTGQHGSADPELVLKYSRSVDSESEECKKLYQELTNIGYKLAICYAETAGMVHAMNGTRRKNWLKMMKETRS